MTYNEAADYILEVPRFTSKNKPEHTKDLLRRLGNPERAFRVIHVAGTNGKGSVCSYLESALRTGHKRTGLFTSPHLVRLNERFRIGGMECTDEQFLRGFKRVMEAVREMEKENQNHPTFFELLFAMAMVIFQNEGMDYVILETGLGGRLDATNSIGKPLMTIITSIGLDHTEYLGSTITEIAAEKAGIIKPGVPVVYDASRKEAADVISGTAKRLKAPAYPLKPDSFRISKVTGKYLAFSLDSVYDKYTDVSLTSPGRYQAGNGALALLALDLLKRELNICREDIVKGIETAVWPGRMEEILPGVILDGAHNEDGIEAFAETAAVMGTGHNRLLFAAAGDKNYHKMIKRLAGDHLFKEIIVTEFPGGRAVSANRLYHLFQEQQTAAVLMERDVRKAFYMACDRREPEDTLFIAGSLYLAGCIKRMVKEEKE